MTDPLSRLTTALSDRYRIERELGQGGMATVFLAEDLKHKRKVAVKVLKPELAAVLGAERFVQEITTTAALQHPHILPLFDSGEADGFLYYVMPFIDGETLRAKLDRETQLSVDEAVRIARDVASALGYAHRNGVIHRDIKPENILLHEGRPMVADFGIALAVSAAAGGRMTETGLSLGTPHYMSPEQATAEKEISARSDVYSLASVLYEMLAGQPPHLGGSAQQIIMKIIAEPVELVTRYRKAVPPNVSAALAKALEKLPADRFDSATAFSEALANPQYGGDSTGTRAMAGGRSAAGAGGGRLGLLGFGVGAVGIAVGAWGLSATRATPAADVRAQHLSVVLPDSAPLSYAAVGGVSVGARALTISPDGGTIVYVARERGQTRLYRRDLDGFVATPIAGTEGASLPMVSPDGEWVAFLSGAELRRVPMRGGTPVTLAGVSEVAGADWAPDGRLLVAAREGGALGWVPQSGGALARLPNPSQASRTHPHVLPNGRHALVTTYVDGLQPTLGVVELETGRTLVLTAAGAVSMDSVETGSMVRGEQPRFVQPGHVVFTTSTGLRAIEFDPSTLRVKGTPVEVLDGVRMSGDGTQYDVSVDGTLVYVAGGDAGRGALVWASRDGRRDSLGFEPQRYGVFSLSPDGQRVVATVFPANGLPELWVYDLVRRSHSKVVTRGLPFGPLWWPDGQRVVFTEFVLGSAGSMVTVRQLVESAGDRDTIAAGFSVNDIARDALMVLGSSTGGWGVWSKSLSPNAPAVAVDSFPSAWGGAFSPDMRWIAYTSNEAGQYEIYVTEAGRTGGRRKLSLAGGEEPVWSPRGDELFYRWGQEWFAIAVPRPPASTFGRPERIFSGPFVNVPGRSHDVSRDGRRHLVILGPTEQDATRLNVITNWTASLTRPAPSRATP